MSRGAAMPDAARPVPRSYSARLDALATAIDQIRELRSDPFHFHAARDAAARTARQLAKSLAVDGL